jgi:capsular exopolysaccharide synthesis family protein
MKDSRELVPTPERREIERPIELPQTGNYPMYRGMSEANASPFFEYWNAIRKRLWLVLGVAVIATTLTAIYMARRPNVYQAKSQVQVDLEQANPDLRMSDRPVIGNSDPAYFNTQLQLLNSDKLLRRVVKELSLDTNKDFVTAKSEGAVSPWQSLLRTLGLASKPKEESGSIEEVSQTASSNLATTEEINEAVRLAPFVDVIRKNFAIDPVRENRGTVKDTRLIDISFKHTNPELAAQVVNGIAEVFIKQNAEKRNKNNDKTSGFLDERIANLQNDIKNDEIKYVELQRDAGIIKTDGEQTILTKGLETIQKNLLDAENVRKNAEAEYNAATRSPESIKAKASEKAERYITEQENNIRSFIAKNNDSITGLQTQREKLLVEYQDTAPEVKEVDRQIAILVKAKNDFLQKMQNDVDNYRNKAVQDELQNLKTKYLSAKEAEDKLRASFDSQSREALGQNQAAISIRLVQQRLEQNKQFLENLIKQQRENDVVSVGTDNNISIADFAIPPDQAVSPRRLTTVLIALLLSTFFGAGLALFLEYLDDSIRSAEEIENLLQIPALAAIPTIESSPRKRLLLVGGDDFEERQKSELLIYADSRSSLAEAYRQLRTSILLSTAGHAPKSLLITSSLPSEGKTTTAVNTAISLAQTGASVLIIDADMRRPRLHSIFNISNAEGLSTTLSSELSEAELLNIVQQDENTKLYLMPSGPVPPNPAELIGSVQMSDLMQELSKHFTHIVVDSPPIASFTDGVLIASMVDGVILVVNSGKSSRQIIKRSRQLLQDIGAKVFGVVLNNVNFRSQDSYYYQSYYHRDYYRHEDE